MKHFLTILAIALLLPAAANAQQLGLRGGVSVDPAFAFGGFRIESSPEGHRPSWRFTFDVGGGEKRAFFYGLGLIVPIHSRESRATRNWSPYLGGTVALVYSRIYSDYLQDGYGIIVGAEHRNRFSFEVQYNSGHVPTVYFVIGYRLR